MKVKGVIKRGLSFAMTFCMALSVLAGCGNAKKESVLEKEMETVKEYVYKPEDIKLDGIDLSKGAVNALELIGDRIYLGYVIDKEKAQVISFKPDGSDVQSYDISLGIGENIPYFCFLEDGSCYIYRTKDRDIKEGEENKVRSIRLDPHLDMSIEQIDNKGNVVNSINCNEKSKLKDELFVYSLVLTDDGELITSTNEGVLEVSFDSGFKTVLDSKINGTETVLKLYKGSDGQIYATDFGSSSFVKKLDIKKGKLSENVAALTSIIEYGTGFFGGNGYDVFCSTPDSFYGYDAQKDEVIKIADYNDSSIELDLGITTAIGFSDTEIIAAIPGFDYTYSLVRLSKVPADQVKDKKIITLAGAGIDWRARQEAVKFNRESEDYQIKIIDYTNGDLSDSAKDEAYQKLDMDIMSGKIPDIMFFDERQDYEKYLRKGMFYDYKPLFEKDEDFKNIKILPSLLDAMTENDKMYTLITDFYIGTGFANQKYSKDSNTLNFKDCDDILSAADLKYDTAFGPIDNMGVLENGIIYSGDKFIDLDEKKCSFDSEDFIKLLEFAGKFPAKVDDGKFGDDPYALYRSGKSVFQFDKLYGFSHYRDLKQAIIGEEISFIGYPNDEGKNESVIIPGDRYAISAQSSNVEAAWDFIKRFWSVEYIQKRQFEYGFPVTEEGLEYAANNSMDYPYRRLYGGGKEYYQDIYPVGDEEIKLEPLTQEEVNKVSDFIHSVDKVSSYNEEIQKIITEEAPAYFSGQKSAEEVAGIIQNRASIYVNESN